ncbi:MAG: outer membrane protein assembly factor BamB family protein [Planctomycetota bacterium]|jgi:outer membrane protein assembly factor BamB
MEPRRTIRNYFLLVAFGLGLCVAMGYYGTAEAADWPNFRGPNHNGISNETGWSATWPKGGPKQLWKKSIGNGYCSIAVSNGRAYTMGNIDDNDILYCFEADTGKQIWKKSYPCPLYKKNHKGGPSATPTVHGDSIYIFSKDGDAIRFKAATGQIVWHKKLNKELGLKHPNWYFASSPFVIDNLVILNAGTRGIALNKADGSVVWKTGKAATGYATAVPFTSGGKKCVAIFAAKEIVGLIAETGKIVWRHPWKTSWDANIGDPIITGNKVFVSTGYNRGCALLKIEGGDVTEIWQNKNMRNHFNSSVLWKGHIYGFDGQGGGGGKLTCLNYETGEAKWSQEGMGTGSVMIADGKLIILSESGKLVTAKASPEEFKELSSAQILKGQCWTVPVLANGRIYARNSAGDLVCVGVNGKN